MFPDKVEIWDTAKRRLESVHPKTEQRENPNAENRLAQFSSSALQIIIVTGTFIELRNITDDRVLWKTEVGRVDKLKMSEDGRYIAVSADSSTSATISILSASDGRVLFKSETGTPADLFQSWTDRQRLTLVRHEQVITQVDLSSSLTNLAYTKQLPMDVINPTGRYAFNFAASPSTGQYAVAGAVMGYSEHPGEVRIRDLASGKLLSKLKATTGKVNCASFYSRGRKLVAGGESRVKRTIELLDLSQGKIICTIDGELVSSVSHDGQLLLTRDSIDQSKLSLWSVKDGRMRSVLAHVDAQGGFFAPNSQALATVGPGGAAIWSVPQLLNETNENSN